MVMKMTVKKAVVLESVECGVCGFTFALPEDWLYEKRQSGDGFYCPVGHSISYTEPENQRLRAKLARQKQIHDALLDENNHIRIQRDAARRSASAHKGQSTRLKKRAAAGVCPCCKRTVSQLAKHMNSKHPGFVKEARSGANDGSNASAQSASTGLNQQASST